MPPFTSPCLSFPMSAREGWRREKLVLTRGAGMWFVVCESLAGHGSALRPRAVLDQAQGTPSASCHPAARSSTLRLSSRQNPVLYIFISKEGSGNNPPRRAGRIWQPCCAPGHPLPRQHHCLVRRRSSTRARSRLQVQALLGTGLPLPGISAPPAPGPSRRVPPLPWAGAAGCQQPALPRRELCPRAATSR